MTLFRKKAAVLVALILASMAVSAVGLASPTRKDFTVFKKKVSFELPTDWQVVEKEVGVPLKMLGPLFEERRPVVQLVPIDLTDGQLSLGDKSKAEDSYKVSRLTWLQTFNGKSISFLPSKTYSANGKEVFQFGHLYSLNGANFEEKSYYIRCNGQTFHLKTLVQVEHIEHWASVVQPIADSFKCQ
jgi:hypothetical protein